MISTLIQLGRAGDVINNLPLAYHLSKHETVNWLACPPFDSILEGCSYVHPKQWTHPRGQDSLQEAIQFARRAGLPNIRVCSVWRNPDQQRQTDSYQLESWRLAGKLDEFGRHPLVFDQRTPEREQALVDAHIPKKGRKTILVATEGVSGPFREPHKLISMLRALDAEIVDLSHVRAERIYDLLGLLNAADCLVTIDTMWLHLARASTCPVVALLNNNFVGTSVPPPQTVASFRYAVALEDMDQVVEAARRVITAKLTRPVLVANVFGQSDRHLRARENWPKDAIAKDNWGRDARNIGNDRPLPYLRDLLQAGLDSGGDTIILTNDDCSFSEDAFAKILAHCALYDFGCVRRDPSHCGREGFFFKSEWLRAHIAQMPDVIIGTERWDLVMARWLRKFRGIKTDFNNISTDFFPVEIPAGIIHHEQHISWWDCPEVIKSAATKWNIRLWDESE